ncbi:MAG: ISAs1 family transposase [Desulfobacterales bacterium]|nr:ISAs1 family transposase [Desulfobacterales bacterium]
MGKHKRRELSADEQHILEQGHLQLLTRPEQLARCDQAIIAHHYLHDVTLVGEHLRYAFVYRGQWWAVATWSSAAFHLKDRDQFIGWTAEQCRRRLPLLANNSRLLVLPGCHSPNLISRFMKLMLAQLSLDWQRRWGHPIAVVETFVDPRYYQGTAYKVSGWCHLGKTAGWKRDADDFYQKNDAPKQIWIRELVKKAGAKLRAPQLPPDWAKVEEARSPRCTAKAEQIRSLMEALEEDVPEFRRAQGLAYPVAGLMCLIVMANAQGVVRGPTDLALYADTLSPGQLRALKFRRDPHTGKVRRPKKTVFTTVLSAVDDDLMERVLLRWQAQILGPPQDQIVVVDGKKVRHAGVEMVNAVDSEGRILGSVVTASKTNDIPAARLVLRQQDLVDKIVLTDALHTNEETARQILFEGGGDYLMTVKGNQPTLCQNLENLFTKQSFSPSADAQDQGAAAGTQPQPIGDPMLGMPGSHSRPSGLSGSSLGRSPGDPGQAQGPSDQEKEMDPGSRLSGQQPHAAATPSQRNAFTQARLLDRGKPTPPLSGHHAARG